MSRNMQSPDDEAMLDLDLVIGSDASAARVFYRSASHQTDVRTVVGTAKKHPKDRPDYQVAEYLAVGRALKALGEELLAAAEHELDARSIWAPSFLDRIPVQGIWHE